LRRNGLFIIETPNPDDPQTVTRDFYLDPTHRHPLPPALLTFLAETKGFARISILSLDTARSGLDYALVARRA
jgi:O-antigen chain-terminating methyltransferase